MESTPGGPDSEGARTVLAGADDARRRLTSALRLPAGVVPAIATGVALQVATAAWGIAQQTTAGMVVLLVGLAVFALVAGFALHRFRRINGARVDGLAGQILLGTGPVATGAYLGALAAATWAAFDSQWWLVAIAAVAGGAGYAFGVRQWWRAYVGDPTAHARGASPRVLVAAALIAGLGLVALLVLA